MISKDELARRMLKRSARRKEQKDATQSVKNVNVVEGQDRIDINRSS